MTDLELLKTQLCSLEIKLIRGTATEEDKETYIRLRDEFEILEPTPTLLEGMEMSIRRVEERIAYYQAHPGKTKRERKSEQEWIEGPAKKEIAFHTKALNLFRTWASKGHDDK